MRKRPLPSPQSLRVFGFFAAADARRHGASDSFKANSVIAPLLRHAELPVVELDLLERAGARRAPRRSSTRPDAGVDRRAERDVVDLGEVHEAPRALQPHAHPPADRLEHDALAELGPRDAGGARAGRRDADLARALPRHDADVIGRGRDPRLGLDVVGLDGQGPRVPRRAVVGDGVHEVDAVGVEARPDGVQAAGRVLARRPGRRRPTAASVTGPANVDPFQRRTSIAPAAVPCSRKRPERPPASFG